MTEHDIRADVLVIGCGIAGATAAFEAARSGLRTVVITKADAVSYTHLTLPTN